MNGLKIDYVLEHTNTHTITSTKSPKYQTHKP